VRGVTLGKTPKCRFSPPILSLFSLSLRRGRGKREREEREKGGKSEREEREEREKERKREREERQKERKREREQERKRGRERAGKAGKEKGANEPSLHLPPALLSRPEMTRKRKKNQKHSHRG
jgi:hypothetical protein